MESGQEITASRRTSIAVASASETSVAAAPRLDFVWRLYPVALVTIFPVALVSNFWLEVWRGVRSRATDGSGHWGVAQIYNAGIFPDTFGWTHAYFGGMPFPNFYPPLFHWLVGLLSATGLSPDAAFKLVLVAPMLLMPAAVWLLAWRLSGKSDRVATCAACACVLLLVNMRLQTSTCGLDYASTFVAGFYTQPLGFVLLLAWFVAYLRSPRSSLSAAVSCALLALTILANFFNAFTGALLVASTLALDVLRMRGAKDAGSRQEAGRALLVHFVTPLVALALCLFWLAPMFGTYEFFATRPLVIPLGGLLTPWLWCWYAVAAAGLALWLRKADDRARAYLLTLLALALGVVLASTVAPPWFPLQAFRFFSTLNFLLAVPVGLALAAALDLFKLEVRRPRGAWAFARHVCVVGLAVVAFGVFQSSRPTGGLAFYAAEENERLESVLRFAREHREGRYLVEVLDVVNNPLHADAPALNAYLGAQGNETLGVVYREASPNSIFFNALANSVSEGKDSFGISSVLADDLDFAAQPLSRQLERALWLGVRYFVVESDAAKEKLASEPAVIARHDFDRWSVFEIEGGPAPRARVLTYRPALVVSNFSVKGRRRNDFDFVRLAEEQFGDGWLDVLLARSTERKIDRLTELENFGALVLDTYDCDDEGRAFELLRDFSQRRTLVLLASDAPLFLRIRSSLAEFPRARIVERPLTEPPGERIESFQPSYYYERSSIRQTWREVRAALEQGRVAVDESVASVSASVGKNVLSLALDASRATEDVPVLVSTTYSPRWRAREGNRIYAATPFFMLTFTRGPVHLAFERNATDVAGLWASGFTLFALCGFVFVTRRRGSPPV
ncbi:MAG TPA: hypothetical protein VEX60_04725 [Pyrinomonadaceae bacterium]|nr:hypothetical protein [Pyrinomonadaceae bacterium]